MGMRGVWTASLSLSPNIRGKFCALVHVQNVPEEEFSENGPPVPFCGVQRDERLVHPIVSDAICASIKPPSTLPNIPRSFADHHSQPRGASVEHHAFNHFFTPRARTGYENDVSVGKSVFG